MKEHCHDEYTRFEKIAAEAKKPKAAETETPTEQLIRVATDTLSQLKEAQEAEEGPWPCMPWPEVDNLEQAIERYKDEVKK
jgi:hypothetical protein